MEYFEQIRGWFDYGDLYAQRVRRAAPGAVFVEVGAYLGRSTAFLASRIKRSKKQIRLYVVDLWDGWSYDDFNRQMPMPEGADVFSHFMRNMRAAGLDDVLCPLKMPSAQAATLFPNDSVDFVFIDGDHGYEGVLRDLAAWLPRVKPGGVIAGHDYTNNDFPGVRRAVDEFFRDQGLPVAEFDGSFVVHKPDPRWLRAAAREAYHLVPDALRRGRSKVRTLAAHVQRLASLHTS